MVAAIIAVAELPPAELGVSGLRRPGDLRRHMRPRRVDGRVVAAELDPTAAAVDRILQHDALLRQIGLLPREAGAAGDAQPEVHHPAQRCVQRTARHVPVGGRAEPEGIGTGDKSPVIGGQHRAPHRAAELGPLQQVNSRLEVIEEWSHIVGENPAGRLRTLQHRLDWAGQIHEKDFGRLGVGVTNNNHSHRGVGLAGQERKHIVCGCVITAALRGAVGGGVGDADGPHGGRGERDREHGTGRPGVAFENAGVRDAQCGRHHRQSHRTRANGSAARVGEHQGVRVNAGGEQAGRGVDPARHDEGCAGGQAAAVRRDADPVLGVGHRPVQRGPAGVRHRVGHCGRSKRPALGTNTGEHAGRRDLERIRHDPHAHRNRDAGGDEVVAGDDQPSRVTAGGQIAGVEADGDIHECSGRDIGAAGWSDGDPGGADAGQRTGQVEPATGHAQAGEVRIHSGDQGLLEAGHVEQRVG